MRPNIFPSKKYKGIFYVNDKRISLRDFRINKFNGLTSFELEEFTKYLIAHKLI